MPQHLIQLLIYLKATGKKRGFVMYEDRNTLEKIIVPINYDEENQRKIEEVFEWLRQVYKAYEDGLLPERVFQRRNKLCQNCPLQQVCWEVEGDGDIKIPKMVPPEV